MMRHPSESPPVRTPTEKDKEDPVPFKLSLSYLLYRFLFPSLRLRGKREYVGLLILRTSIFLSISYGLSITAGLLLYYINDIFSITNLIWNPDEILALPFLFTFDTEGSAMALFTNYLLTIFIPCFIAGTISGIFWRKEARDLIFSSSFILFLLFLFLHLSQSLLFTTRSTSISGLFASIWYLGYVFAFAFSFLVVSILGGAIGVQFGNLLTNLALTKKGAQISYSHLLLPEIPFSVKTIFDLDTPPKTTDRQLNAVSMVYLSHKVNMILRSTSSKTCPYFDEGACSYLGYRTASHKYQICITEFWGICKIYAFLNQSKLIIDEVKRGENDVKKD